MRRRFALAAAAAAAALALGWAGATRAQEFSYPVSGPLTSTYYSPRPYGYHRALDIAGPNRGAVGAARSGTVSYAAPMGSYGNLVIVDHEAGYQTYYAHLHSFAVQRGQYVAAGQTIGYEGSTGRSTGPHVHFEVRRYGTKQWVPGSVGNYVSKGRGLPHDYPGIGAGQAPPPSGSNGGGGSGATGRHFTGQRVTASVLNVRTGPSTANSIIGTVLHGQVYVSSRSESGWYKIWYDGREGWSYGGYLARTSSVEGREVSASALNVRSGPGTGYQIVATVPRGQIYARAGSSGDWIQIWFGGALRWFHGAYTNRMGL